MKLFREEEIAIIDNIDSMFYQVHVPLPYASFLRHLWYKNVDSFNSVFEY